MRILDWTEHVDGWHAGPFHIEFLGRKLWVLSVRRRRRGADEQQIIASGASRGAMMAEAGRHARRRLLVRRVLRRSIVLILALAAVTFGALSADRLAPLASIVGSTAALIAGLSLLNAVAGRAFDHLSSHYQ